MYWCIVNESTVIVGLWELVSRHLNISYLTERSTKDLRASNLAPHFPCFPGCLYHQRLETLRASCVQVFGLKKHHFALKQTISPVRVYDTVVLHC